MPIARRIRARVALRGLALALAIWTMLWQLTGDTVAPVRWGLYLAPFLMGAALTGGVAALLSRARPEAAALVTAGGLLAVAQPLWPADPAPAATAPIRLTTLSNRTRNQDMAATAAMLRKHVADIFVIQEVADPPDLLRHLAGLYRTSSAPAACHGKSHVILSRHPVSQPHPASDNVALACRVALPRGPVWVVSTHLPRAVLWNAAQERQARAVVALATRLDAPVILAGDLNATPLTGPVRLIGKRFRDVFDAVGRWPGFTFPTPARRLGRLGAFLRIDHVFASPAFRPVAARVERWHPPGADHFPVTVVLDDLRGR